MADSAALLRLLEPAVRPTGDGPSKAGASRGSDFASADFAQLLDQAHHPPQAADETTGDEGSTSMHATAGNTTAPLTSLGGIEQIDNPSLRRIMETNIHPAKQSTRE